MNDDMKARMDEVMSKWNSLEGYTDSTSSSNGGSSANTNAVPKYNTRANGKSSRPSGPFNGTEDRNEAMSHAREVLERMLGRKLAPDAEFGHSDNFSDLASDLDNNLRDHNYNFDDDDDDDGGQTGSADHEERDVVRTEAVENSDKPKKDEISHKLYQEELKNVNELEIHNLPGRGRGFIAKKLIKPGSIILKVKPTISTLQNQHLKRICHGCFLTAEERSIYVSQNERERLEKKMRGELKLKLNRCASCKVLHYCSKECQISDWSLHKHECVALQRFRKMYYNTYPNHPSKNDSDDLTWTDPSNETVRALARIIWKRKDERDKNGGKDGLWWKQIASLETHINRSPEKEMIKLAQQAQHLQHYLSASIPLKSKSIEEENRLDPVNLKDFGFANVNEVMRFCSSFHVNSFTLSSPSLSPIGVSNSPLMALSNHSCDPNAVVVFPNGGKFMELIAIKDIQPNEEILTSYIDLSCPYSIRQRDILERYRFSCNCTLCEKGKSDENWVDPRWCVKHIGCKKGEQGKGKMPDKGLIGKISIKCDTCDENFEIDSHRVLSEVQRGVDLLDQDEIGQLKYHEAKKEIKTLIPTLQKHIPNCSYPLLSLLRLSSLVHTPPQTPSDLDISIRSIKAAYEGSLITYPKNHPISTICLAEYSKLSSLTDSEVLPKLHIKSIREKSISSMLEAIELLNKSIKSTNISFGIENKGGIVNKEMKGILFGCQSELDGIRSKFGP
ncbi:uncharacterized protein L201_006925 [Kwoniella dendrophila CBS 6074]|uniref:SET domain-containing protein n=1 Tax=Kwoniella dendrophila CBS 6074 TaxID=1295534 RepID=A0AAX4K350_9TREE